MGLLNIPSGLAPTFQKYFPGFWEWLTGTFEPFIATRFVTQGDVTYLTVAKGPVVRTPDGTKKYRLGVDNSGNPVATLVP